MKMTKIDEQNLEKIREMFEEETGKVIKKMYDLFSESSIGKYSQYAEVAIEYPDDIERLIRGLENITLKLIQNPNLPNDVKDRLYAVGYVISKKIFNKMREKI